MRQDGLDGIFIAPKGSPRATKILVLSGSLGGANLRQACVLARRGFAAFALAYFNRGDLPAELERIPLEYFSKGLDWMGGRAVVWGVSRGGELALLLGSTFPAKVRGVIAVVPSAFVWAAPKGYGKIAAWTYRGADVPYVPSRGHDCVDYEKTPYKNRRRFDCSIDRAYPAERAAATIPVERIQGPILLISGDDDQLWPSDTFARSIVERLAADSFSHEVTWKNYPNAGHLIGPPRYPLAETSIIGDTVMGGTPEGYAFANSDSFREQLSFLSRLPD